MSRMRRLLREVVPWVLLALVIAAAGLFAWATHNADSPLLAAAEDWPAVGGLVAGFRQRWAPPPGAAPGGGEGGTEVVVQTEWIAEHGERPPPPEPPPGTSFVGHAWVAAGAPLRAAPEEGAAEVGRVPRWLYLPVLERREPWARVIAPTGEGWVLPVAGRDGDPPMGRAVEPPRPLPGRAADPEVLTAALDLLGVREPAGRLGPYPLYTDAPRSRLFALDRVAAAVEPAYRARYGRTPVGEPRETVVLFADEAAYRRFQAADDVLAGLPAAGHTGGGVVAVFLGGQGPAEVAATLVHELAHLLNRRALGPALPPWLDEGMADDLAGAEIGADGSLVPGRIGGSILAGPARIEFRGAVAAVRQVDQAFAAGRAVPLARLTALEWEEFVRSEESQLHYAQAGLLVRYLLDGGEQRLAAAFRRFLDGVAAGGPASGEALRAELGRPWSEIEAGMAAWVRGQVRATQPPPR
jgi:hypothetical protein